MSKITVIHYIYYFIQVLFVLYFVVVKFRQSDFKIDTNCIKTNVFPFFFFRKFQYAI